MYPNHQSLHLSYLDIGVIDGNGTTTFLDLFWDSGHSSGELETHTHTTTMHPGNRLSRRGGEPTTPLKPYVPMYLPTYQYLNFCYSTTGHDHDRPGALRPMPASPTQPHTYKLPAASVDYIPTCSRPLIEFPTVSKKKAVRNH